MGFISHIKVLGLQIVVGSRDARGEPVVRSRRGDQQGRAITRIWRDRRQDIVDFHITIRAQRYAGRVRAVSGGVAERATGAWCSTEQHGQNSLAAVRADDVTAGQ